MNLPPMRRKLHNNKCHLVQGRTVVIHDGKAQVSGVKKQKYGRELVNMKWHFRDLWINFEIYMYVHIHGQTYSYSGDS